MNRGKLTCFMSSLSLTPPLQIVWRAWNLSHGLYMGRVIPSYFLHTYFLHIFLIFLHTSSYFLHIPGTWKKFRSLLLYIMGSGTWNLPLYIGPGTWKKIWAISSMDMKHVSISGTWTGIFIFSGTIWSGKGSQPFRNSWRLTSLSLLISIPSGSSFKRFLQIRMLIAPKGKRLTQGRGETKLTKRKSWNGWKNVD